MERDKFVCVAVFPFIHESLILRALLEAEGIEYFAENENVISVQPFYSNAVGGIRIQVLEDQAERALEIVAEMKRNEGLSESETDLSPEELSEGDSESVADENSAQFKDNFRLKMVLLIVVVVIMFTILWFMS